MSKIEYLINAEIDDKKLRVPVISIHLEGNKEKVFIDIGASASFVAIEWCKQYTVKV